MWNPFQSKKTTPLPLWDFPDLLGIEVDEKSGVWWPSVIFLEVPKPDPFPAKPTLNNRDPHAASRRAMMPRAQQATEKAWLARLSDAQAVIKLQGQKENTALIFVDPFEVSFAASGGKDAYESGVKVSGHNPAQARDLFEEGAYYGNILSQYRYAVMCDEGMGGPVDQVRARRWYFESANSGYMPSMNNLAWMYVLGEGGPIDTKGAVEWMTKAAEKGYPNAQNNLGAWCVRGDYVPKDEAAGREWHRKAAEQGFAPSEEEFGAMLYMGSGGPKDLEGAFYWYSKAATAGRPNACFMMFKFYICGIGVSPDQEQAKEWVSRALDGGSPLAIQWLQDQQRGE